MRTVLSDVAKRRMREHEGTGLLRSDWMGAVFIHYRVEAETLQPYVPFELDLHDGAAYVSFVAFALERMRLNVRLSAAAWLTRPIATHPFLNLRTYVKRRGEAGIYFLAEWLPNRLSLLLGPRTFGLPYRLGALRYRHGDPTSLHGSVESRTDGRLTYHATAAEPSLGTCDAGTHDEFLLERYTAFTQRGPARRRFRVWHEPWAVAPIDVRITDDTLLHATGAWASHADRVAAHWSPGVTDVWMGRPVRLRSRFPMEVTP